MVAEHGVSAEAGKAKHESGKFMRIATKPAQSYMHPVKYTSAFFKHVGRQLKHLAFGIVHRGASTEASPLPIGEQWRRR